MVNQRQLLLGAFFVIVLSLLGVYTLFLTDFSLFKERHTLVVHFPQASGLRQGDSVLVAGIPVSFLTMDGIAHLAMPATDTFGRAYSSCCIRLLTVTPSMAISLSLSICAPTGTR